MHLPFFTFVICDLLYSALDGVGRNNSRFPALQVSGREVSQKEKNALNDNLPHKEGDRTETPPRRSPSVVSWEKARSPATLSLALPHGVSELRISSGSRDPRRRSLEQAVLVTVVPFGQTVLNLISAQRHRGLRLSPLFH